MRLYRWAGCLLLFLCGPASAQTADRSPITPGRSGVGVIAGNPTGATWKYLISPRHAVDVGLGFSGDFSVYADFLWHAWDILPQPEEGRLAGYVGAGPRLETDDDAEFGIRTIVGAAYWFPRHPIEAFLEVGPLFRFAPGASVGLDGGVGLRFYF